jgi:hypothetical protein
LTREELEARLAEAVIVLRCLPDRRVPAEYGCSWPDPAIYASAEWLTYQAEWTRGTRPVPAADAIDRTDEVMIWMSALATSSMLGPMFVRTIWARAAGYTYQEIADRVSWINKADISWGTIRKRYHDALDVLERVIEERRCRQAA